MKLSEAMDVLRIMKKSYTEQSDNPATPVHRRVACHRRMHALDIAMVAITAMEETSETVPDPA